MGKRHVLVVANRTADSDELMDVLRARGRHGGVRFTLLMPARPHGVAWAADMHTRAEEARRHMERAVQRMRRAGLEAEGRLGDPDPVVAVEDTVANGERYDEAIVSTYPPHISHWLKLDLPRRVERATGLAVQHVVTTEAPVAVGG